MTFMPNLFIPGVAKSATTFLFSCLGKSPDIYTPELKEMHFMASEYMPLPFSSNDPFKNYEEHIIRDLGTYQDYYTSSKNEKYLLDCSPTYLFYPDSAKNIKQLSPDAKIIISLRNPVDRAFSQYKMNVRIKYETMSFEDALADENNRIANGYFKASAYKSTGLYSDQVKSFVDTFGIENIHFLFYRDISIDSSKLISSICSWLGIEFTEEMVDNEKRNYLGYPRFKSLNKLIYNKHIRKLAKKIFKNPKLRENLNANYIKSNNTDIKMKASTRNMLENYYRSDIGKLEMLTGLDFSHWTDRKEQN